MQIRILGLQGATSIDTVRIATANMATEDVIATVAKTNLTAAEQAQLLQERGLSVERANMIALANTMASTDLYAALTKTSLAESITAESLAQSGLNAEQIAAVVAASNLTAANLAQILATTSLTKTQQIEILTKKGLSQAEAEAAVATAAHTAASGAGAAATLGFAGAATTAKVAVKGLTAALAANPYILIIAAVIGLVAAFNKLSTAAIDASEKSKEAAQKAKEAADVKTDEEEQLSSLIEKYKELKANELTDADSRTKIRDVQKEINKLVGGETEGLDLVNGKLDEQLKKLKEIELKKAQEDSSSYIASYSAAKKSSNDAYIRDKDDVGGLSFLADWWGYDLYVSGYDKKVEDILEGISGVEDVYKDWNFGTYTDIKFDADNAQEYYDIIQKCIKALEDDTTFYHQDNQVYNKLVKMRDDYKEFLNQIDDTAEALAQNSITIESLTKDIDGDIVNSAETYDKYRSDLLERVKQNENLKQAIADGKVTDESLGALIDDSLMERFPEYYQEWLKYKKKIEKTSKIKVKFETESDIDKKIDGLTDEELEIAYKLVADSSATFESFDDFKKKVDEKLQEAQKEPYDYYNYKQAEKAYKEHLDKINEINLKAKKYGNVDLNNLWYFTDSDGGAKGYQGNYGSMASNGYQNFVNFSTWGEMNPAHGSSAYAMFDEYNGLKLSVTPYFWADDWSQPEVLNKDTVHKYIDELVKKAGEGYSYDDLLRLDADGIDVDGMHIKGIIADIGDTAEETTAILREFSIADAEMILANERLYQSMSKTYKDNLSSLWNSEDFEETKKSLIEMAKTVDGITPDAIRDLAEESEALGGILDQDGMTAEFLANILQAESLNGNGFDLITDSALRLNTALEGMNKQFGEIDKALQKYNDATSSEKDDNFKAYADAFSKLNDEFSNGTINSNQFWASAELIFGQQQLEVWGYADGVDKIYEAMKKNVGIFEDADSAGAGFLDKLNSIAKNGQVLSDDGTLLASIQKLSDGSYSFDVDALHLDELATKMGLSKDAVLVCLEALSKWGDVDYYNIDEVLDAIKEIGLSTDDFDGTAVNVEALTDQLITLGYTNKEIHDLLGDLKGVEGITLIDVNASVETLTGSLENLGIAAKENGKISINIDNLASLSEGLGLTKEDAEKLITKLYEADGITMTSASGEVKTLDDALSKLDDKTFTSVTSETDKITDSANAAAEAVGKIQTKINALTGKTVTITINEKRKTSILGSIFGYASGTDNAYGGVALVGEKGEELVKSGDKAYLVGSNGAELVNLNKGDIVYNANETKKIKSGSRIGGVIPAFSGGYNGGAGGTIKTGGGTYQSVLTDKDEKKSGGGNKTDKTGSDKEPQEFDWIEVAIDRIERAIDRLKNTATSTYKALKTKLGATASEITKVNQELALQEQAYNRYIQQANSVGLSSDLASKVRNGTVDINSYDEETKKLIDSYSEWYNKALDCSDAIQELHENLASLYEDNFNNIKDDFDSQLELYEHLTNTYNTGIDKLEAKGRLESTKYVAALKNVEQQNIAIMNKELDSLIQSFSEAMASGEIEEKSESWYDFQNSINEVKEAIDEANLSLLEYDKTMREINWGYFDYMEDRISQITAESDFLIDLMSNSKMYDDNGQLTNEGLSTMGLHGVNYNVYMAQADDYAAEILKIDKEIANDPYNTDLIERREELLGLQQDSIKAAEDEKQAIVSLVEEGIKVELDNLKELIDTYTKSLDSAKSLYDYQKKVADKTKEIGNIEKQLAAYSNDTSEETRTKIQKLTVELQEKKEDLQETEYEQFISDTKKLLDELYIEYEQILNQRLDDVDQLISDMIDTVNANADTINSTITDTADSVGYTITSEMATIWDNAVNSLDGVIAKYDKDYGEQLTSVNGVLAGIQATVNLMVQESNKEAEKTVATTTTTTKPTTTTTPKTTTTTTTPKTTTPTRSDKDNYGVALAIINGNYGWGTGETRKKNLKAKGFNYDTVQGIVNKLMKEGYVNSGAWVGKYYGIKDLAPYHYNKYLHGGLIDYTGLAQVDGTPGNPELMLNSKDTKNFLELRDVLRAMSSQALTMGSAFNFDAPSLIGINDVSSRLATLKSGVGNYGTTVGDISITIPIEHIDDYNDFITQLQQDKQFEKLIQSMTIDRLAGGSPLAKNKFKW